MRRTECLNGFWDGVEGGLGGAVWLLVGRHCGWLVVVFFLEVSRLTLQWYVQQLYGLDSGMVWYPRTVSLSRKVPNADVAGCSMVSDSFLLLKW